MEARQWNADPNSGTDKQCNLRPITIYPPGSSGMQQLRSSARPRWSESLRLHQIDIPFSATGAVP